MFCMPDVLCVIGATFLTTYLGMAANFAIFLSEFKNRDKSNLSSVSDADRAIPTRG